MVNYGAALGPSPALGNLLERGLALFPDAPALVTDDAVLSWRELDEQSRIYARSLLALGLAPGDRVASLLPNCGALFVHYFGVIRAGLVAVPMNFRYTSPEIAHALEVSGARALVYDASRRDDIAAAGARGVGWRIVHGSAAVVGDELTLASLLVAKPEPAALPEVAPDTPAFVFFTSGSTGPAKGVTHSHQTFAFGCTSLARGMQLAPDDRSMAGSSCSHVGGLIFTLASLVEGASAIVPPVGDPDRLLEMMRQWRPTILVMLPNALFEVERNPAASGDAFASVRLIVSGGDKVPAQLTKEVAAKLGLRLAEGYGMTEILISHGNPSSGLVKEGSVGRVNPGFSAEIRAEDGTPPPVDQPGRLFVKFPGTMIYYWNAPEATAAVYDADGWLDTGDVMQVDADGYFHFCGRKKQIIVHDGSNIVPQEVEEALLAHEAVAAAGVVGIHDLLHGENVRAYVTLKEGAVAPSASELIAFARERVGYKAPEEVVFIDDMPLNATGKVDRVALKQRH